MFSECAIRDLGSLTERAFRATRQRVLCVGVGMALAATGL